MSVNMKRFSCEVGFMLKDQAYFNLMKKYKDEWKIPFDELEQERARLREIEAGERLKSRNDFVGSYLDTLRPAEKPKYDVPNPESVTGY